MARKRKSGKRDKSGKLLRPRTRAERAGFDHGNDRVQDRAALFSVFRPNKALKAEEHCDGPGQAYLAGLFDNLPADALALRDAAREFGELFWYFFADLQAKSANLAGSVAGRSNRPESARDRRFARMDEALGPLSSPARRAVYSLCVDYWGSDEIPPFLDRLINEQRLRRHKPVAGRLPDEQDKARWTKVCEGLLLMVSGEGTTGRIERSAA